MTARRIGWSGVGPVLALAALAVGAWMATRPAAGWFGYAALSDSPLPTEFYFLAGHRILGLVLVGIGLLGFGGVVGYRLGRRRAT